MSVFHQFVRGNSGSGPGRSPLTVAAIVAMPDASTVAVIAKTPSVRGEISTQ
jgi:hypothetical protein